ncbi:MAG: hypothetical protein KC618_01720 [Candidatus Omnitrophica bacterium]|nr:hypothetical protein [Candidatus Omnitrophota bacterium]
MAILIGMLVLVISGLGAAAWLFMKDKDSIESSIEQLDPDQITTDMVNENEPASPTFSPGTPIEEGGGSESLFGKIMQKLKFGKKDEFDNDNIPQATSFEDLKKEISTPKDMPKTNAFETTQEGLKKSAQQNSNNPFNRPKQDTPSLPISEPRPSKETTDTSAEKQKPFSPGEPLTEDEQKALDNEIEQSISAASLQEKYERLDKLFKEKSAELQKAQSSLDNEQKNRKDFNKVKDILEKEIKDLKDQNKDTEIQLQTAKKEIEDYKQRVNQLEDKSTQLEKELITKEQEIEELKKSPVEAAAPEKPPQPPAPAENDKIPDESPNTEEPIEEQTPKEAQKQEEVSLDKSSPETAPSEPAPPKEPPMLHPSEPPNLPKLEILDADGNPPKPTPIADEIENSIKSDEEPVVSEDNSQAEEQAMDMNDPSFGAPPEKPKNLHITPDIQLDLTSTSSETDDTITPDDEDESMPLNEAPEDTNISDEEKISELERKLREAELEGNNLSPEQQDNPDNKENPHE